MKKSIMGLVVMAAAGMANAQFTEGFEHLPVLTGVGPLPTGWEVVNISPGGPGTNPFWQTREDGVVFGANTGNGYAFCNYNASTGANAINNWMMSPVVTFNVGDQIKFWTRTVDVVGYPDRLSLAISTAGASTDPANFTTVLVTVNPNLTLVGYPSVWTQYTGNVTVAGSGRIGWRHHPDQGGPLGLQADYIGVDDVQFIKAGPSCRPDLTTTAAPGSPGYGVPNGQLNSEDFFYFLAQYAANNLAVCDLTNTAAPGSPGYGVPNGILNSEDFFYYLAIYAAGCNP